MWIQETVRCALLDPLIMLYTQLGNAGLLWIALCVLMLFFPKTRKAGLAGAAALLCSLLCTNVVLKHLVSRTRPWLVVEGLIPLVAEGDPNSFPSGHTLHAFAAACSVGLAGHRRLFCFVLPLAALIGFSRIYLMMHYPLDVFAGALLGFCAAAAARRLLPVLEAALFRRGGD